MANPRPPAWRADRVIRGRARQLRREPNTPELALWEVIRNRQLDGYRFRRQHPIGDFIVDFVCVEAGLVVEVDGDSHADQTDYDRRRTRWLRERKGYSVLRVTNADVMCNPEGVHDLILSRLRAGPPDHVLRDGGKLRRKKHES